jgi:hypothetical protein
MRGTWQTTDGGGSGGLVLVVIVALVLIGSGAASAAASALASLLVTIAIVLGSVTVLAVLGVVAWLVWRPRQDRPARLITARPLHQLAAQPRAELPAPASPAIEPGREVHLHLNVTPDQLAAIMRHYTEESS